MKKKEKELVVRRMFTDEEKMRAAFEAMTPGVNVSEVARKYNITPALLFNWRKKYGTVIPATKTVALSGSNKTLPAQTQSSPESGRVTELETELKKTKDELFRVKSFLGNKIFELESRLHS